MNRLLVLLTLAFIPFFDVGAEMISMMKPHGEQFTVVYDGEVYLSMEYKAWRADGNKLEPHTEQVEYEESTEFRIVNVNPANGDSFVIEGAYFLIDEKTIGLEAAVDAEGDVPVGMVVLDVRLGREFQDGSACFINVDGAERWIDAPFARDMGFEDSRVETILFQDGQNRQSRIDFDLPVKVTIENGWLRVVVSEGQVSSEAAPSMGMSLELPHENVFVPGIHAARRISSHDEWFRFSVSSPIPDQSEWSMSQWLEKPAGKHGRIIREGDRLMYNGNPIKIWGINNSFSSCAPTKELADKRADFYAAVGINSVRMHKFADGAGWAGILDSTSAVKYDPVDLDNFDYYVSALKKRGIYVKLSPVFIVDIGPDDSDLVPFLEEFDKDARTGWYKPLHGAVYLSTELQDLLIKQMTTLLEHTNPYTGLKYADDPAVAYIELYNEDSALWQGTSPSMSQSETLRRKAGAGFASWLKAKYGTKEKFTEAWGDTLNCSIIANQKLPLDESWEEGRIYPAGNSWFYAPENLNTTQAPYKRRLLDTMRYLYEVQNMTYARLAHGLRAAGYQGEIISSNWQAGNMMSHFYNLHSDSMEGTIDRHNYFGAGDDYIFNSASMLSNPGSGTFSSSLQQVSGNAFMLSEWIHCYPNEWGVEGPAIIGAYGMGLQGWDASYAFQNNDDGEFLTVMGRKTWEAASPQFMGIFPAVSRQIMRGDVKEAEIIHERYVHIPTLDRGIVGFEEDVRQAHDVKEVRSELFPQEGLAAVRSVVTFVDEFTETTGFDLNPYLQVGEIVSCTDQLRWHRGESKYDGYIEIDTPGTQALVGFAKNHVAEFTDSKITLLSRFGAVYLSAQSPHGSLSDDHGILISAIARARNENAIVIDDSVLYYDGKRENGPIVMEPVIANIHLRTDRPFQVYILDHAGVKTGETLPVEEGSFQVDTGAQKTPYYLIQYE